MMGGPFVQKRKKGPRRTSVRLRPCLDSRVTTSVSVIAPAQVKRWDLTLSTPSVCGGESGLENHDALAADNVVFHVVVRLDDLVQRVDPPQGNGGVAARDGVQEPLQGRGREV